MCSSIRAFGFKIPCLVRGDGEVVDGHLRLKAAHKNFSIDAIKRYKPAPETYRMVAAALGVEIGQLRLVAAHGGDILGAMQAGCSAAFIARKGQTLFPLVKPPDVIGPDLSAVAEQIVRREKG